MRCCSSRTMMWSRHSRRRGANHSLHNSVRCWRVDRGGDGVDADASGALTKITAVNCIVIAEQMPWRVSPGCGLDHLSPDPGRPGAGRHVDVDQHTPTMSDENEHVQGLEGERWYAEEVGCPEVLSMVAQERSPGLAA